MSARSTKAPFEHMRQFKAIAMDYEYYLTLGDEGQLYCLSDRQIYILLAQMDYVGWLTRWYNTADITQTTVKLIQSDLMESLMSCVDVSILVDQGKLNTTRNVQQQQIQSQQLRDGYAEEYDGSPTSINPNAPTGDFGSTGDRADALCAGLMAFVYQFAKAQIEALVAGDVAAFALLAGAALLLIPGLNLFFIAGASLALLAGGGIIGVTTGVAIAALSDTTALNNVVCFMRDTLKAQSVSEANWAACLDTYPWEPGSNEAIIVDFIKPTLATNYLGMLDMLGQAYSGTINGEPLPLCPCATPTFNIVQSYESTPVTCDFLGFDGDAEVWRVTSVVSDEIAVQDADFQIIDLVIADDNVPEFYNHETAAGPFNFGPGDGASAEFDPPTYYKRLGWLNVPSNTTRMKIRHAP
jgi:hypothetical protein